MFNLILSRPIRKGNASGRGRQSGGQERGAGASGGLLAASCEARPSNMYRAPSAEPTGHLASLRRCAHFAPRKLAGLCAS